MKTIDTHTSGLHGNASMAAQIHILHTKATLMHLRDALADLQAREDAAYRSRTPVFRGSAPSINAALGQ